MESVHRFNWCRASCIALIFLLSKSLFSASTQTWILESNFLDYERKNEVIFSSGNVRVKNKNLSIQSDEATFFRNENKLSVKGNVLITDGTTTVKCKSAIYQTDKDSAFMENVYIEQKPFFIFGEKVQKQKEKFFVEGGYITTCDKIPPHYRIAASKIFLKTNDHITLKSVFLKFGKVSVLWLPYWWQKIGERKWDISLRLGYSSRYGNITKTRFIWYFSKSFKTILINDYFSKLGWGKGIEFVLRKKDVSTNFYTYHIKEKTGINNFNLKYSHWQTTKGFLFQTHMEYQKCSDFNWDFRREETSVLKPAYLLSRISLSKTNDNLYFRISGYRNETWHYTQNKYIADDVLAPELYFYLKPLSLKFLKLDAVLNHRRIYKPAYGYHNYTNFSMGYFRIFKNFKLTKFAIFYPKLGLKKEKIQNVGTDNYHFHELLLRIKPSRNFYFDATHVLNRKFNRRATTNILYLKDELHFSKTTIYQNTSYDFNRTTEPFKNRLGEISTKITIRTKPRFYFLHKFSPSKKRTTYWEAEASAEYFSTRITKSYLEKDHINLFQTLKFSASKWHIKLKGRFYFKYSNFDINKKSFTEKEVVIKRNLHCWDMLFKFLLRKDRKEAWLLFNISAMPDRIFGIYRDYKEDGWSFRRKVE